MDAPIKIRKIYKNGKYNGCKGKDYFEIVRVKNGAPIFEIWCSAWLGSKRTGHREYKVAWRETLTQAWVNSDVCMSMISGYTVRFYSNYYDVDNVMLKTSGTMPNFTHGWNTSYSILWNTKDVKKCDAFKYIKDEALDDIRHQSKFNLMKLLRNYIEYPKSEYLINNKLGYMVLDKRFLKIKSNEWNMWICKNRFELSKNQPDFIYCRRAFNTGLSYEELYIYNYLKNRSVDVAKYLMSQCKKYKDQVNYISCSHIYNDYIDAIEILNVNENRYPENIHKAHDKWTKRLHKHNSKILNDKLNAISTNIEKSIKNTISKDGLSIKLCHSRKDFETLGSKLHNCVARMNYDVDMTKGRCLIFGIWKDQKPIECVEIGLQKKPYIVQCLGDHNQVSEYHDTCMELCNKFIRKKVVRQLAI